MLLWPFTASNKDYASFGNAAGGDDCSRGSLAYRRGVTDGRGHEQRLLSGSSCVHASGCVTAPFMDQGVGWPDPGVHASLDPTEGGKLDKQGMNVSRC